MGELVEIHHARQAMEQTGMTPPLIKQVSIGSAQIEQLREVAAVLDAARLHDSARVLHLIIDVWEMS